MTDINRRLFSFIKAAPTAFHAVSQCAARLDGEGFCRLSEADEWRLEAGHGYYVTRNGSSLIAFRIPSELDGGFMIAASHGDSPSFKVKDSPELSDGCCIRLSTEGYGGMLCSSWLDRPLGIAGRVVAREGTRLFTRLFDSEKPLAVIPNVAIHMNRRANEGTPYNNAVDMLPLFASSKPGELKRLIAERTGISADGIVSWDLSLYCAEDGCEWGEYISAPRLDDLQCVFASLEAFVSAKVQGSIPMLCVFDNEEVGSLTRQGADSTFLFDTMAGVCDAMSLEMRQMCARSYLVSCDNAHALHPNHPELSDKNHSVRMNGGVVIKYNANQKYTSDGMSVAIFRTLCERAGAASQLYANRADIAGGSTLGNISNAHVSLCSVDVGLPQLAMHSAYESAGRDDTQTLERVLESLFSSSIIPGFDGDYVIKHP